MMRIGVPCEKQPEGAIGIRLCHLSQRVNECGAKRRCNSNVKQNNRDYLDETGTYLRVERPEESSYSGMFPCFFLGLVSFLFSSARKAVMTRDRVVAGSIMASI
jgi:hypothetical protein